MNKKIKIGIVGCGEVTTRKHIPAFKKNTSAASIVSVCDLDENVAKNVAETYGIPTFYTELDAMLENENLDILDVATPPQTHSFLAKKGIAAGCNIIMEKPMALSVSDCDDMIHDVKKHDVKLSVIHNKLYDPPFIKARELIRTKYIGDFIGMRILLSDPREEMILKEDHWMHKLPGGLISETGPHVVYMSLEFLNEIKDMEIFLKNYLDHPWAPYDEVRIELEGEKAISSVVISYASNRRDLLIELFGTDGMLTLDLQSQLIFHRGQNISAKPATFAKNQLYKGVQYFKQLSSNAFRYYFNQLVFGHERIITDFIKAIINNDQPMISAEDGRKTTEVMEMIVREINNKLKLQ